MPLMICGIPGPWLTFRIQTPLPSPVIDFAQFPLCANRIRPLRSMTLQFHCATMNGACSTLPPALTEQT